MTDLAKGARIARTRRRAVAALAAASLLALAGCSGGSIDDATGKSGSSEVVTNAMKPVESVDMPTEAFTPPKGKKVLILECGSVAQGCVRDVKEMKAIADSLGWNADVVDGKLDPTVWNQVVKQAAESGVDGIIVGSADPNLYSDAMQVVAAKKIPFVIRDQAPRDSDVPGISTYISTDPEVGGKAIADWIKADSDGKASVLVTSAPGYQDLIDRAKVIVDTLKSECSGCTVETADITAATMGTSLAPLITNRLQKNPKIDYVWGTEDCCVSFIQQGIRQAGKSDTVKLLSMTGYPDQMKQIKSGEVALEMATPASFESWLTVDSLARLMADVPTEKYWRLPQRIWTKVNIDEATPEVFTVGWNTEFDYESAFKKMWGMDQ